jgi:hypothetical protein
LWRLVGTAAKAGQARARQSGDGGAGCSRVWALVMMGREHVTGSRKARQGKATCIARQAAVRREDG